VRPRLDEVLTAGHRLRDLLLAAAHGLDHDRLAYALALLGTEGVSLVNTGIQPRYVVDHYEDFESAVAYLQHQHKGVITLELINQSYSDYETFLVEQNDAYAEAVSGAIDSAVQSVGYDPVVYGAWAGALVDTLLAGAGCLLPELGPIRLYLPVIAGAAVGAATSWPTPQQKTFADQVRVSVGGPANTSKRTNWYRVASRITKTASDCHNDGTAPGKPRWTDHRARLEMLRRLFKPEFIMVSGGGLPMLDTDAIGRKTTRDLLLAAVDKKGVGGHLVYEYTATNVFYRDGLDGADPVYCHPAAWKYQLDKTVLAVTPQLVGTLTDQQTQQPIVSSDVGAPVEIIVTTTGTPSRVSLHLDYQDNVTGLSPRPLYWWDGQHIQLIQTTEKEWGQALKTFAWVATTGQGERPRERVSAVAQEEGGVL